MLYAINILYLFVTALITSFHLKETSKCTLTSHVWSKLRFSNIGRGFLPFKALCAGAGAAGGFLPPKQPADRRRGGTGAAGKFLRKKPPARWRQPRQ